MMEENYTPKEQNTEQASLPSSRKHTAFKIGFGTALVILTLCCSLLSGCLGVLIGLKISNQSLTLDSIIEQLKANNKDTLPSGQIAEAAAKTIDSVVTVYGHYSKDESPVSISSGVVVAKTDDGNGYYIVTCAHSVDGYPFISIGAPNGKAYWVETVGTDFETDLALLRANVSGLTVATPRSAAPYLGETIIAHGNPLGNVGLSTSFGIVSQVSAKVTISGVEQTLIKVDMALNHGNSGGGVFDMEGNLIGIASAKISESNGTLVEGVGYAIPTSIVYDIIDSLKNRGFVENRPFLGINLKAPSGHDSKLVVLDSLFSESLKAGDIIQKITLHRGDKNIELDFTDKSLSYANALAQLRQALASAEEGDRVALYIKREGGERYYTVTVHLTNATEHADI